MIAFYGYDGFLYSIGYLAGWVVALFVIAEPLKRLGKFTFADALDSPLQLAAASSWPPAISTLVVSIFYLIPQMVGAGVLVKPLLGLAALGRRACIVGAVVILIVVTAGMVSTTWVQFIKGGAAGRLQHDADRDDSATAASSADRRCRDADAADRAHSRSSTDCPDDCSVHCRRHPPTACRRID